MEGNCYKCGRNSVKVGHIKLKLEINVKCKRYSKKWMGALVKIKDNFIDL